MTDSELDGKFTRLTGPVPGVGPVPGAGRGQARLAAVSDPVTPVADQQALAAPAGMPA